MKKTIEVKERVTPYKSGLTDLVITDHENNTTIVFIFPAWHEAMKAQQELENSLGDIHSIDKGAEHDEYLYSGKLVDRDPEVWDEKD